jgi:sigma-B regulation protein RsbU (phosphoserine phosphatase)
LFVTAGVLHCDSNEQFTLSMAGHPPLLQFRKASGEVVEHSAEDLPLGVLPEQQFSTRGVDVAEGDVLVLLTDGMTEVFDADKKELGLEPVKEALRANALRPLPELSEAMREVALGFGKQEDDQTLLLIRAN